MKHFQGFCNEFEVICSQKVHKTFSSSSASATEKRYCSLHSELHISTVCTPQFWWNWLHLVKKKTYTRSSKETFASPKVRFQLYSWCTVYHYLFSSFHWSELTKNACFKRSADLKWQILSYAVYKNSTNPTKSDTTTVATEKFKDTEFISSVRQTDLREIHW